ncbi:MAG: hypothetical protein IJ094_06595 [Bacilli bacterium]|nr:hypothetical protein [Bacilli bacterium]
MIIKAVFDHEGDFDYIYCPENISIEKSKIKELFYDWIDNTNDEHPFKCYENGEFMGLCYRGDAIVYWLNKYIINNEYDKDNAKILDSYSSKDLNYDLKIIL